MRPAASTPSRAPKNAATFASRAGREFDEKMRYAHATPITAPAIVSPMRSSITCPLRSPSMPYSETSSVVVKNAL